MALEEFYDWAEEHGVPLSSWAQGLEERGIPSFVLLAVPLLVIGALAFVFLSPVSAQTGSLKVIVSTPDGIGLANVNVSVIGTGGFQAQKLSNDAGAAYFEGVPVGDAQILAYSPDVALQGSSQSALIEKESIASVTFLSQLVKAEGVRLTVDVQNAPDASIFLFDAGGRLVSEVSGVNSHAFVVPAGQSYRVRAEREGFLSDERNVTVFADSAYVELLLQEEGKTTQSSVSVRVFQKGVNENPVPNATVFVSAANDSLFTLMTAEDGSTETFPVLLGTVLDVRVVADGFDEFWQGGYNITQLQRTLTVELERQSGVQASLKIRVLDEAGDAVFTPLVRLYEKGVFREEQVPDGSVAGFNVTSLSGLSAGVYKPGFLPAYLPALKNDQTVRLVRANENNSGRVRVSVSDRLGRDVTGATVHLLGENRQPTGLPPRNTLADGSQTFADVPLKKTVAFASDGVREKYGPVFLPGQKDEEDNDFNATLVDLQFDPLVLDANFRVLDRFSGAPIPRARVAVADGACTTGSNGTCVLAVQESDAVSAVVSADGYESFSSADFAVYPGQARQDFTLVSLAVAADIPLDFQGVFDAAGRKTAFLAPLSEYEARYVIHAPNVSFQNAEAFVQLEGDAALLGGKSQNARITTGGTGSLEQSVPVVALSAEGFYPSSVDVEAGGRIAFLNQDNVSHSVAFDDGQVLNLAENETKFISFNEVAGVPFRSLRDPASLTGLVSVAQKNTFQDEGADSVLFEYASFNGSNGLAVRFKTGRSGEVVLSHRSAFFTETQILQSPTEGLSESGRFALRFGGTCSDEVCVQLWFDSNGRNQSTLDLALGRSADLKVAVVGLSSGGAVQVDAPQSVILTSGKAGTQKAVVSNGSAVVAVSSGASESSFSLTGRRLSGSTLLDVTVYAGNESVFQGTAELRVVSKTAPALSVSIKPKSITALAPQDVTFTVKDGFGESLSGALVVLGDEQIQEQAPGQYVAPGVLAESLSPLAFEVKVEGFKAFSGSIPVKAPDAVLEVSPEFVALSVDSTEAQSGTVTVANLLSDRLSVGVSVDVDSGGKYTQVDASTSSLRLDAKGSASIDLSAAVRDDVLALAQKAGTLREDVKGTLRLSASTGAFSDVQTVRFTINTAFAQTGIDDAWTLSPDALSFEVQPPKRRSDALEISVQNDAPYPLVFNLAQDLGLSVAPASLIVPAGGTDAFRLSALLPPDLDCFSADAKKEGSVTVHATFQGISSKKTAQTVVDVSMGAQSCRPPNGMQISLPVDSRLGFLPGAQLHQNPDGSTSVRLSSGDVLWFDAGSSVTPVEASVPTDSVFMLPRQYVNPLQEGGWTIVFPVQLVLSVPDDVDRQPVSGATILTLENAQIILPPGVLGVEPQALGQLQPVSRDVLVPPGLPVTFRRIPFNYDALNALLPPNPVEVQLPADAVLELPPGTVERKTPNTVNFQGLPGRQASERLSGVKGVQLPGGEKLAFGVDALVDVASLRVRLPAKTPLYVDGRRVKKYNQEPVERAFELTLPVPYALTVTGSPKPVRDEDGKYALKLNEEGAIKTSFNPALSKVGAQNVVRVVRESPVTFLKGALSRVPTDPDALSSCTLSFNSDKTYSFTLPEGTAVVKKDGGYRAVLSKCDASAQLTFEAQGVSDVQAKLFETPAVRELHFPASAEFFVGSPDDESEKAVRTTGAVSFRFCTKDEAGKTLSDSLSKATLWFTERSLISVPERVLFGLRAGQTDLDLGAFTPVSVQAPGLSASKLGFTKKLSIQTAGKKVETVGPPDFPAAGIVLEAGQGFSFAPSCKEGNGRLDVSATADQVTVKGEADADKDGLKVSFSNKNLERSVKKGVCIYNAADQAVLADGVSSDLDVSVPAHLREALRAALPTDSDHAYFADPGIYGNKQKVRVEPASQNGESLCHKFTLEIRLPDEMLFEGQCVRKEYDGTFKGKYAFAFKDVNGETVAQSPAHVLPVELQIDAKESDCRLLAEQATFRDLLQVSVNYDADELKALAILGGSDRLAFKSIGHTRPFTITNNDANDVTLAHVQNDANLVTCFVEQTGVRTRQLAVGERLAAGSVLLVSCDAAAVGSDTLQLRFQGGAGTNIKNIPLTVYDPGALSNAYPATPIGRAMPFLSKAEVQAAVANVAPFSQVDFADPVPQVDVAQDPDAAKKAAAEQKKRQEELQRQAQSLLAGQRASFDFRFCKTYFCSFDQSRIALDSFIQSFSALVKQQSSPAGAAEPTVASLGEFCRKIQAGGKLRKSMVLQLSNVEASSVQRQEIQGQLKSQAGQLMGLRSVEVDLGSDSDVLFSGCGIYQIEATLNPACDRPGASVSEWKSRMALEIRGKKLASCPVGIQNAALLTADEPVAYTGNKVGDPNLGTRALTAFKDAAVGLRDSPAVFGTIISAPNDQNKVLLALRALGQLRQGVLGPYGETSDSSDEKTVKSLYAALYSATPGPTTPMCTPVYGQTALAQNACPAVKYDDNNFCWREGGPVFGTLLASQAAITLLQGFWHAAQLGNPLSIGLVIRSAVSNYRVLSTTAACTASFLHAGAADCTFLSQCTSAVLAGLVESLPLPGSWSVLGSAGSLRGATIVGTTVSSFGNVALQTAAGYGALYGIDLLTNNQAPPVPVAPVTIIARYPSAAIVSGVGTVARYTIQPVRGIFGGGGRQKAIDDAVRQLERQGVSSAEGRRIASRAISVLHDAGKGSIGAGFANPLIKALNSLDDAGVAEFRRNLNSPIGGDRKALAFLARKVADSEPAAAAAFLRGGDLAGHIERNFAEAAERASLASALGLSGTPTSGELATQIAANVETGKTPVSQVRTAFSGLGRTLPDSALGVTEMRRILNEELGRHPALRGRLTARGKLSELLKITTFRDASGNPFRLSSSVIASSDSAALDLQRGYSRTGSVLRTLGRITPTVAALFSAFLFDTDFRPVQIRLYSGHSNAHVVALHDENGRPTAQSVCLSGDCKGGGLVLDAKKLCSNPNGCLKLIEWQNGNLRAYALIAGFAKDSQTAGQYLDSLFVPETPPLAVGTQTDFLRTADVRRGPIGSSEFAALSVSSTTSFPPYSTTVLDSLERQALELDALRPAMTAAMRQQADRIQQKVRETAAAYRAGNSDLGNRLLQDVLPQLQALYTRAQEAAQTRGATP